MEMKNEIFKTITEKRLFSIDGAASTLGISPWTLRLYARKGLIRTVKIGSRRLVSSAEITRVMREGIPAFVEEGMQ